MNEITNQAPIEETMAAALLLMARLMRFAPKPDEIDAELIRIWSVVMLEEGIDAPLIHATAMELRKTRSEWPTPDEFLQVARKLESVRRRAEYDAAIRANQAAPSLAGPVVTKEERAEILGSMEPGPREFFLTVLQSAMQEEGEGRREASRIHLGKGHGKAEVPPGEASAPGSTPHQITEEKKA